ncbi:hypothetical protein [Hoeflea sp.]|uniref:hypothetical protein n=1 Tax=Hoeflea sp. TaxID=1940281 RepID=UPI0031B85D17|nr:hypothetical protein [Alphaproteobacteria bacterium]MBU4543263.1 hypothetical protein [Alphaproteobacteria bacterium]MBU4549833.1 hypothetical protein [Alphaproteobacteria bacterium]
MSGWRPFGKAGGWQHQTRPVYAAAIRASSAPTRSATAVLSERESMVMMAIGYFQPVMRSELSALLTIQGQFLVEINSWAFCSRYKATRDALPIGPVVLICDISLDLSRSGSWITVL